MRDAPFILVMERGFVLVVRFKEDGSDDALFYGVKDVAVIRRWGTTKGLGQLAKEGPLPDTILEREECDLVSKDAVYRRIRCDQKAWSKWPS